MNYGYGASLTGTATSDKLGGMTPDELSSELYGYAMAEELFMYRDKGNAIPADMEIQIANYNNMVMAQANNPATGVICSSGPNKIEEGTVISSQEKRWTHTVSAKDRNIMFINGKNRAFFEVIKRDHRPPGQLPSNDFICSGPLSLILDTSYKCTPVRMIPAWCSNFNVITRRGEPVDCASLEEQTAAESLRDIISEEEFRKYLKYGFVMVRGSSGLNYQIFRNQSHTKVWKSGKVVEEICVNIANPKIPLTDKILAFKTIIETSEDEFRSMGNVYKMAVA